MTPLNVFIDPFGMWHIEIFLGLVFCLFLGIKIKIGWAAKALWFYTLTFSLYLLEFPSHPYGDYNTAFQATAGQTLAEVLLIPLAVLFMSRSTRRGIWFIIRLTVIFEILCVWANWEGLLIAPSFNTAYIALALPFCPAWIAAIGILTILFHHGSTALLIVLAEAVAFALKEKKLRIWILPFLSVLVFFALIHRHGEAYFDGNERLLKYQEYLGLWSHDVRSIVFGSGPGSFIWLSLMMDNFKPPLFLQMHSDWLQILFELGVIGITLTMATVYRAIKNAWDRPFLLAGVFGCIAFGMFYHPTRFFPSAFLIAMIFSSALKQKGPSDEA